MKSLHSRNEVDEILSRLQRLQPNSPRRWGKMSAHQMICHLNDAFKLYTGVITAAPVGFPYPSRLLKWSCLWVPLPWPHGFKTVAEVDQERGGTAPATFDQDLGELKTLVIQFAALGPEFAWPSHPYLGRMSHTDWMRLGYLHTDHHLRQFGV